MTYLTLIQLSDRKNNLNEHGAYTDSAFSARKRHRASIYLLYSTLSSHF